MIYAMLTDFSLSGPVLFAARGARRRRGGADTGEVLLYLAIAAVVIGVICGTLYAVSRYRLRQRFNSHSSLFTGLCQRHELDRGAQSLLKQIAGHHNLKHPARVFIEPKLFDPNGLGGSLRSQGLQVAALRNQLFGGTSE